MIDRAVGREDVPENQRGTSSLGQVHKRQQGYFRFLVSWLERAAQATHSARGFSLVRISPITCNRVGLDTAAAAAAAASNEHAKKQTNNANRQP